MSPQPMSTMMMMTPPPPPPPGPPPKKARSRNAASPRAPSPVSTVSVPPPPPPKTPPPQKKKASAREILEERRRAAMAIYESNQLADQEEHVRTAPAASPTKASFSRTQSSEREEFIHKATADVTPTQSSKGPSNVDAFIYKLGQPDSDDSDEWVHPALAESDAMRPATTTSGGVRTDDGGDWSNNHWDDSDARRIGAPQSEENRRATLSTRSNQSDADTVQWSNQVDTRPAVTPQMSNKKGKKKKKKSASASDLSISSPKRGFFKKIMKRGKQTTSPVSTPRRARSSNNKPSSPSMSRTQHGLKPGQSYQSTPNSAEIVVRQHLVPKSTETMKQLKVDTQVRYDEAVSSSHSTSQRNEPSSPLMVQTPVEVETGAQDIQFVRKEFSPRHYDNEVVSPGATSSKSFVFDGQVYDAPDILISEEEESDISCPSKEAQRFEESDDEIPPPPPPPQVSEGKEKNGVLMDRNARGGYEEYNASDPGLDVVEIDTDSSGDDENPASSRHHVRKGLGLRNNSMLSGSSIEEEEWHSYQQKKVEISFKPHSLKKSTPSSDSDQMTAPMTFDSSFSSAPMGIDSSFSTCSVEEEPRATLAPNYSIPPVSRKPKGPSPEMIMNIPKQKPKQAPKPLPNPKETTPIWSSASYLAKHKNRKARKSAAAGERNPSQSKDMLQVDSRKGMSLSSRAGKRVATGFLSKPPNRFTSKTSDTETEESARRMKKDTVRLKLKAMQVEARIMEEEAARARDRAMARARQQAKDAARAKAEATRIANEMKEQQVQQVKKEAKKLDARKRIADARTEARALRVRARQHNSSLRLSSRKPPVASQRVEVDSFSVAYGLSLKARNKCSKSAASSDRWVSPEEKRDLGMSRRKSCYEKINLDSIKDPIQRAGVRLLSKSAVPIQAEIRRFLAKKEAVDRMWALVEIQCCFRRWKCEAFKMANVFVATKIQSAYRGNVARASFSFMAAALKIQKTFRGRLARLEYERSVSCLRIQSAYRGSVVREQTNQLKHERFAAQSIVRLQTAVRGFQARVALARILAAIDIQAFLRGCIVRRKSSEVRAACTIQAVFRGWAARDALDEQFFCIREIQRVFRGNQARKWTKRERAAISIQSSWRSFCSRLRYQLHVVDVIIVQSVVRRRAAIMERQFRKHNNAAVTIQSRFRSYVVRRRVAVMALSWQRAAKQIQQAWRDHNVERGHVFESSAATIQKAWRGFWQYSHFIIMKYECVRIQALFRGYRARNQSDLRLGCAIVLQTVARGMLAKKETREIGLSNMMVKTASISMCENTAALVITRFFVMVKSEVDREVQRRLEKRSSKGRRRRKAGYDYLEVISRHDRRSQSAGRLRHGYAGRSISPAHHRPRSNGRYITVAPSEDSLTRDGDPPGLRAKEAVRDQKRERAARERSQSNPRYHSSGARELEYRRSKSTPRGRDDRHAYESHRYSRYEHRPTDSVGVTECDDVSEMSGFTLPTIQGRSRYEKYNSKQLAEDLSLEEAWIDAGIHRVKEKRVDDYLERRGLRRSSYDRVAPSRSSPRGGDRYFFPEPSMPGDESFVADCRHVHRSSSPRSSPRDAVLYRTKAKSPSPRNISSDRRQRHETSSRRHRDVVQPSHREKAVTSSRSSARRYYEQRRHDYGY